MKTISRALIDEIHYPIPVGFVENVIIKRGLYAEDPFTQEFAKSCGYQGALADCLYSLVQAMNFSESDKSIGSLSDNDKKLILKRVNSIYKSIGEPEVNDGQPMVFIGG
jgi:hypothetical protein